MSDLRLDLNTATPTDAEIARAIAHARVLRAQAVTALVKGVWARLRGDGTTDTVAGKGMRHA